MSGTQESIDLFIKLRNGLIQKVLRYAKAGGALKRLVIFNGPHGTSLAIDQNETILMIATGVDIVSHLPYLRRLIYGY